MLTGAALKAKFAELRAQNATEDQATIACGYVTADGKAQVRKFKDALQEAHGLALPKASKPKKGKPLAWNVAVSKTGVIPVSAGYSALLGLEPGDRVDIKHDGTTLILAKAAADASPDPVVVTAAAAVATDDTEELTITAPAAPEPVRELAPF